MAIVIDGTGTISGVSATGITTAQTVSATNITTGTLPFAQLPTGSVLQVVSANFTYAGDSTTSTSFVATSMTASITPKFSTSKILVMTTSAGRTTSSNTSSLYTVYRNSTNLGGSDGLQIVNESSGALWCSAAITYLDAPATTSATTYTIYFRAVSGTAYFGFGTGQPQQIVLMEIAA